VTATQLPTGALAVFFKKKNLAVNGIGSRYVFFVQKSPWYIFIFLKTWYMFEKQF
jgi:hypothetical protein